MILLAIFIGLFALTGIYMLVAHFRYDKTAGTSEIYCGIGCVFIVVTFILCTLCVIIAVAKVEEKYERGYIEKQTEYEVLIYRIENQKDHVLEDTELYSSVLEYNKAIRYAQKAINSKWIGIFQDKSVAKCKEIDLSAFGKETKNDD